MSRQRRRRSNRSKSITRDRISPGVVIECACGQRLADLYSYGDYSYGVEPPSPSVRGVDGVEFVHFAEAAKVDQGPGFPKMKSLVDEDWWEVTCTKCRSIERGRWPEIRRLVLHAERIGARRIAIGRRHEFKSAPSVHSRDW